MATLLPDRRRSLRGVLGILCALACVHAVPAPRDVEELRVGMIFRFSQFVTWPRAATDGRRNFGMCVVRRGADNHRIFLALRRFAGRQIQGMPVTVRETGNVAENADCHVVYVGRMDVQDAAVLPSTGRRPVLTIGNDAAFLKAGGIVALGVQQDRLYFELNLSVADTAGLGISSELLSIARAVQ